jgi:hypothetical protein
MSTNTNKRVAVKWIRDRAKSAYEKSDHCYICGGVADLELHHLASINYLLETWAKRLGHDITTDAGVLAIRDQFIAEHNQQIYVDVFTLCNRHHVELHGVYGKSPLPHTVPLQQRWLERKRALAEGKTTTVATTTSFFKDFI